MAYESNLQLATPLLIYSQTSLFVVFECTRVYEISEIYVHLSKFVCNSNEIVDYSRRAHSNE